MGKKRRVLGPCGVNNIAGTCEISSNRANSFGENMAVRAGPSIGACSEGPSKGGPVTSNGPKINHFSSGSKFTLIGPNQNSMEGRRL